MAGATNE